LITGWGDLPDSPAGAHAAVDFVLSKPVTLEALHDALSRLATAMTRGEPA
jgi:FixJ family two-component response regulator